jgi:hypothetical protein
LISTGDINNAEWEKLLRANLPGIEAAFAFGRFVEITRDTLWQLSSGLRKTIRRNPFDFPSPIPFCSLLIP